MRSRIALRFAALAGVAATLSSCEVPVTQVFVGIDTDLSWGPGGEIQSVTLEIRRGDANGTVRSRRTTTLGTGAGREPLALWVSVVASDPADTTPLWIEALGCARSEGCSRETAVVAQRASVRFSPRSTGTLRMLLARACTTARCAPSERCDTVGGRCTDTAAHAEVTPYRGTLPPRFASGAQGSDGGMAGDAAGDASSDVGATIDTGMERDVDPADAGSTPPDASIDAASDATRDASADGTADVSTPESDVVQPDVFLDAAPPATDAASTPPRPIAPLSLGDVTQHRPTLHWEMPGGYTTAEVQLCRDRACTNILETLQVAGTSTRPTADLPARSVVFWRVRARGAGRPDTAYGPVWLFHVPARSASGGVDTSHSPHLDLNGDGYDDLVATLRNPGGNSLLRIYLGSAAGLRTNAIIVAGDSNSFGVRLSGAGDVNGDGFGDLIVAAPTAFPIEYVKVYLGRPDGIDATSHRVYESSRRGSFFGSAIDAAGDVNRDGYGDILIGAFTASPNDLLRAGLTNLYLGGPAGLGQTPARMYAGTEGSDFGFATVGSLDIDGDGYSDFVVGSPSFTNGSGQEAGAVFVFHGSPAGPPSTFRRSIEGTTAGLRIGSFITNAGDYDGDGYSDLMTGAPDASPAGVMRAGTASVLRGGPMGFSTTPTRVIEGSAPRQGLGGMCTAGDFNGDGLSDLAFGFPSFDGMFSPRIGTALLFMTPSGGAPPASAELRSSIAFDGFASVLIGDRDFDGDGYSDLVVGAPLHVAAGATEAGRVYVFRGSAAGIMPTPVWSAEGSMGGFLGYSLADLRRRPRRWICDAPPRDAAPPRRDSVCSWSTNVVRVRS